MHCQPWFYQSLFREYKAMKSFVTLKLTTDSRKVFSIEGKVFQDYIGV